MVLHLSDVNRSQSSEPISASSVGIPSTARRISYCATASRLSGTTFPFCIRRGLGNPRGYVMADLLSQTSPSSQSYHSIPPASGPGEMVTLPPPQHQHHPPPDLYRPPMYDMYVGHPQDPHRPPPPHIMYQNQPAPRQRTAIACRYCRRRKVSLHNMLPIVANQYRSAVRDSRLPRTVDVRIASASSKNVSSPRYHPRLKLLYQHTPPIHISERQVQCHPNEVEPSILNRVNHQQYTAHMVSR